MVDPKSISTKITLSVKSGPGVIIGITEMVSINGQVDFSGLQFDQPGDYVISVKSDSNEIESTEFNIKISPTEEVIPQEDKNGEEETKVEGDRPIIAQINQPKISLPPIEFDVTNSKQDNNEIGFGLGFTPFFWYNTVQIPERDIKSLELYHDGIIPMVSINFIDTLDFMKGEGTPLDDTKFEIFLSSGSDNLKSIHLKFKLKNFQSNKGSKSYTIIGTVDLTELYQLVYKSHDGTSFEVLKQISSELKLGFNSNISNTNDSMKWSNTGIILNEFINKIISHSYISDNSFMLGYIDHYWCFNYVDIEKEWNRDISNDVGINSQGISQLSNSTSESEKILSMVLTNEPSQNNTSFYFSSFKINNNSTYQSIEKGHYTVTKYYDSHTKSMLIFDIDSLTSNNDEVISLKGAPMDKKVDNNYRTNYLGRIDTKNIHKNYHYSKTQNRINLDNLVKITADLELPQANYNLYKFQKIKVNFINEKGTVSTPELLNERNSGEWIIIDIRYTWKGGKLLQKLKIARKELNKIKEELEIPTESKENKVSNSEINENPIVIKPNEKYSVGDKHIVINKDNKKYEIIIIELSENGKEITGKLREI